MFTYLSSHICSILIFNFSSCHNFFCHRYVKDEGKAVERFLSLYHVHETTSATLKVALVNILDHYKLSIRGKDMMVPQI
jgi:hypothetical protein